MRRTALFPFLAALALLMLASGCPSGSSESDTYRVRGVVTRVADDGSGYMIRHEAIDEFRNEEGKKVGMAAMAMGFTLSPDLTEKPTLEVGTKLEFEFAVNWKREPRLELLGYEVLPEDTELAP